MIDTIGAVLPAAAVRFGDAPALVHGDRTFSFAEIDELSARLAAGLAHLGVAAGDVVTLYSPNRWEWVVTYYAIARAGAVINPVNALFTPREVEFVAGDCGSTVVVTTADRADALASLRDRTGVRELVVLDSPGTVAPAGSRRFADVLAAGTGAPPVPTAGPDDLSTICYTSGTTGHPKGAMQSHCSVLLNAAMTAQFHLRTSADTVVSALPCPHVYGTVVMNSATTCGMTLVLHTMFDPVAVLASIEDHRATMFEGVPTMYLYLLDHLAAADGARPDVSSLTRCTVGGQTMAVAKMREVEERLGCPLIELWGMTELAGLGTTHPSYGPNVHGSIGIALPYTETRIAATDDASITLPPGEIGELMVRGPLVMQGYFGNPAATAETIEADGWLHTGDVAYRDQGGHLFVVDRKKDMILTAGYNVYPAEIERVLSTHPAVSMVAVGALPDETKGEIAKAYVVLKPGRAATADELVAHCRGELAAYKVPREVQFVDDLPKTSTGKLMRRALRQLDP